MSTHRILGCDPGLSGALALLVGDEIKVLDSPVVASEIDPDELTRIVRDAKPDFAVVERVASMPGNGSASMFSSASHTECCAVSLQLAACPMRKAEAWRSGYGQVAACLI